MLIFLTLFLFSLVIIYFYVALSLGTQLPSSMILASFRRKKRQTFTDLVRLFTDTGLIDNRLDDLIGANLVAKKRGTFVLTGRGRVLWRAIWLYRWVFHRTNTG